jgi:hypothetical protein
MWVPALLRSLCSVTGSALFFLVRREPIRSVRRGLALEPMVEERARRVLLKRLVGTVS